MLKKFDAASLIRKPFDPGDSQSGMSLIEIILVISLMATIMAVLVRNLTGRQEEALKDTALLGMKNLMQSVQEYKIHTRRFPTTEEGLQALVANPGVKRWKGPYTEPEKLNDPWDNPIQYRYEERRVQLASFGPDGEEGTEDDLWVPEREGEDEPVSTTLKVLDDGRSMTE